MEVFHGSNMIVASPLVHVGRKELDFGPGFYVTNLREQAIRWAKRICVIRRSETSYICKYVLDEEGLNALSVRSKLLLQYNQEWLDFVVASRRGEMPWQEYDIIEGGVANDNVIDTVEDYYQGRITVEQALGQLRFVKPTHQMCIRKQVIIDQCLQFTGYETI